MAQDVAQRRTSSATQASPEAPEAARMPRRGRVRHAGEVRREMKAAADGTPPAWVRSAEVRNSAVSQWSWIRFSRTTPPSPHIPRRRCDRRTTALSPRSATRRRSGAETAESARRAEENVSSFTPRNRASRRPQRRFRPRSRRKESRGPRRIRAECVRLFQAQAPAPGSTKWS